MSENIKKKDSMEILKARIVRESNVRKVTKSILLCQIFEIIYGL